MITTTSRRLAFVLGPALLALLVLFSVGFSAADTPSEAAPLDQHSDEPAAQPAGTGLPEVDALLDAVLRQDLAALVALAGYSEAICVSDPQEFAIDAPPTCDLAGVSAGTIVRFLPISGCHAALVPEVRVPDTLSLRLRGGNALYGVYGYTPDTYPYKDDPEVAWPTPEYAVFVDDPALRGLAGPGPRGTVFYLHAGKVIRVSSFGVCGPSTPDAADPGWIIPPR